METLSQSLGRRLRKLRDDRDLSRETVCTITGLSVTSLVDIEKGKQWPSAETLDRLARYFNVNPAVFFTDDIVRIEPTPAEALEIVARALQEKPAPVAKTPQPLEEDMEEIRQALLKKYSVTQQAEIISTLKGAYVGQEKAAKKTSRGA